MEMIIILEVVIVYYPNLKNNYFVQIVKKLKRIL
jgi:hypothetical protein